MVVLRLPPIDKNSLQQNWKWIHPDFLDEAGLNLALGLVTSCWGRHTACCWLGWGSISIGDPGKSHQGVSGGLKINWKWKDTLTWWFSRGGVPVVRIIVLRSNDVRSNPTKLLSLFWTVVCSSVVRCWPSTLMNLDRIWLMLCQQFC